MKILRLGCVFVVLLSYFTKCLSAFSVINSITPTAGAVESESITDFSDAVLLLGSQSSISTASLTPDDQSANKETPSLSFTKPLTDTTSLLSTNSLLYPSLDVLTMTDSLSATASVKSSNALFDRSEDKGLISASTVVSDSSNSLLSDTKLLRFSTVTVLTFSATPVLSSVAGVMSQDVFSTTDIKDSSSNALLTQTETSVPLTTESETVSELDFQSVPSESLLWSQRTITTATESHSVLETSLQPTPLTDASDTSPTQAFLSASSLTFENAKVQSAADSISVIPSPLQSSYATQKSAFSDTFLSLVYKTTESEMPFSRKDYFSSTYEKSKSVSEQGNSFSIGASSLETSSVIEQSSTSVFSIVPSNLYYKSSPVDVITISYASTLTSHSSNKLSLVPMSYLPTKSTEPVESSFTAVYSSVLENTESKVSQGTNMNNTFLKSTYYSTSFTEGLETYAASPTAAGQLSSSDFIKISYSEASVLYSSSEKSSYTYEGISLTNTMETMNLESSMILPTRSMELDSGVSFSSLNRNDASYFSQEESVSGSTGFSDMQSKTTHVLESDINLLTSPLQLASSTVSDNGLVYSSAVHLFLTSSGLPLFEPKTLQSDAILQTTSSSLDSTRFLIKDESSGLTSTISEMQSIFDRSISQVISTTDFPLKHLTTVEAPYSEISSSYNSLLTMTSLPALTATTVGKSTDQTVPVVMITPTPVASSLAVTQLSDSVQRPRSEVPIISETDISSSPVLSKVADMFSSESPTLLPFSENKSLEMYVSITSSIKPSTPHLTLSSELETSEMKSPGLSEFYSTQANSSVQAETSQSLLRTLETYTTFKEPLPTSDLKTYSISTESKIEIGETRDFFSSTESKFNYESVSRISSSVSLSLLLESTLGYDNLASLTKISTATENIYSGPSSKSDNVLSTGTSQVLESQDISTFTGQLQRSPFSETPTDKSEISMMWASSFYITESSISGLVTDMPGPSRNVSPTNKIYISSSSVSSVNFSAEPMNSESSSSILITVSDFRTSQSVDPSQSAFQSAYSTSLAGTIEPSFTSFSDLTQFSTSAETPNTVQVNASVDSVIYSSPAEASSNLSMTADLQTKIDQSPVVPSASKIESMSLSLLSYETLSVSNYHTDTNIMSGNSKMPLSVETSSLFTSYISPSATAEFRSNVPNTRIAIISSLSLSADSDMYGTGSGTVFLPSYLTTTSSEIHIDATSSLLTVSPNLMTTSGVLTLLTSEAVPESKDYSTETGSDSFTARTAEMSVYTESVDATSSQYLMSSLESLIPSSLESSPNYKTEESVSVSDSLTANTTDLITSFNTETSQSLESQLSITSALPQIEATQTVPAISLSLLFTVSEYPSSSASYQIFTSVPASGVSLSETLDGTKISNALSLWITSPLMTLSKEFQISSEMPSSLSEYLFPTNAAVTSLMNEPDSSSAGPSHTGFTQSSADMFDSQSVIESPNIPSFRSDMDTSTLSDVSYITPTVNIMESLSQTVSVGSTLTKHFNPDVPSLSVSYSSIDFSSSLARSIPDLSAQSTSLPFSSVILTHSDLLLQSSSAIKINGSNISDFDSASSLTTFNPSSQLPEMSSTSTLDSALVVSESSDNIGQSSELPSFSGSIDMSLSQSAGSLRFSDLSSLTELFPTSKPTVLVMSSQSVEMSSPVVSSLSELFPSSQSVTPVLSSQLLQSLSVSESLLSQSVNLSILPTSTLESSPLDHSLTLAFSSYSREISFYNPSMSTGILEFSLSDISKDSAVASESLDTSSVTSGVFLDSSLSSQESQLLVTSHESSSFDKISLLSSQSLEMSLFPSSSIPDLTSLFDQITLSTSESLEMSHFSSNLLPYSSSEESVMSLESSTFPTDNLTTKSLDASQLSSNVPPSLPTLTLESGFPITTLESTPYKSESSMFSSESLGMSDITSIGFQFSPSLSDLSSLPQELSSFATAGFSVVTSESLEMSHFSPSSAFPVLTPMTLQSGLTDMSLESTPILKSESSVSFTVSQESSYFYSNVFPAASTMSIDSELSLESSPLDKSETSLSLNIPIFTSAGIPSLSTSSIHSSQSEVSMDMSLFSSSIFQYLPTQTQESAISVSSGSVTVSSDSVELPVFSQTMTQPASSQFNELSSFHPSIGFMSSGEQTKSSSLSVTSVLESSSLSISSLSESSPLPSSSILESSSLSVSSVLETSSLSISSLSESSPLPSSSILESSSLSISSVLESSSLPVSSVLETSSLSISSVLETSSLPSTSVLESSGLSVSSMLEMSSLSISSVLETSSLPSTSVLESSGLSVSSMLEMSSLSISSVLETSSLSISAELETSSLSISSVLESSLLPSTSILESSALSISSVLETSSLSVSSVLETSSLSISSLLESSPLPSTSILESSALSISSVLETSSVSISSVLETSSLSISSVLETSSLSISSLLDLSPLPSTSILESSALSISSVLETSSLSISSVLETSSPSISSVLETSSLSISSVLETSSFVQTATSYSVQLSPVVSSVTPPLDSVTSLSAPATHSETVLPSMSVTSSTIVGTSSSVNTTTSAPSTVPVTTPSLNTSTALKDYWVVTVIKVNRNINITSETFRKDLQSKLAEVYEQAFIRQDQINNGTYKPLRRRKRYAVSGETKLQLLNVSRDSSNVSLTYLVERKGSLVPAVTAVERLSLLDDQEVALGLGHVVVSKAETYVKQTESVPSTTPVTQTDSKLWIIGAVLGSLVFVLFLWILICICCRSCCGKDGGKSVEPHLVKIVRDGQEEQYEERASHPECADNTAKDSGFMRTSPKKMAYEVNPESTKIPETHKMSEDVMQVPRKKRNSAVSNENGSLGGEPASMAENVQNSDTVTSVRKLRRKKPRRSGTDQIPVKEEEVIPEQDTTSTSRPQPLPRQNPPLSQNEMSTTFEEEEELLEKAEMERHRNKQRLREQKRRNRERTSPTKMKPEDSQKEIDRVLGTADLPEVQKNKRKNTRRKNKTKEGQMNNGFENDSEDSTQSTESLEEARKKMHQLLDDAFSLISSSQSSFRNRVSPSSGPRKSQQKRRAKRSKEVEMEEGLRTEKPESEPKIEEKKHTPMFLNSKSAKSTIPVLEAWSPYRASDEVALISLPTKKTDIGPGPVQQPLATTTFTESYPTSLRDNYYTTEPAEPIFIKTADLDRDHDPDPTPKVRTPRSRNTQYNGIGSSIKLPALSNGNATVYPGIEQFEDIPLKSLSPQRDDGGARSPSNGTVVEPHRPPRKDLGRDDEIDIITECLKTGKDPTPLIRSLREELEHLSGKMHVYDSNVNV